MITLDNAGFWAYGRQKDPVAHFVEGSSAELTPSYPPRLVGGSKTPFGRAGLRSAQENLKRLPTNELGMTMASSAPLEPPRRDYNKGQIPRLTGPGFKIPPPLPWSFDAANRALDSASGDPKDESVESMMKAPLSPEGYMDLLKTLVKSERDPATKQVLKTRREELVKLNAGLDIRARQGRMPDADSVRRREQLHDEIDRFVLGTRAPVVAVVQAPGGPQRGPSGVVGAPLLVSQLPISQLPISVPASLSNLINPARPFRDQILAIADSKRRSMDKLQFINQEMKLGVSFQGQNGRTKRVIAAEMADAFDARQPPAAQQMSP